MARKVVALTISIAASALFVEHAIAATVYIRNPGAGYRQSTSVGGEFRADPETGFSGILDGLSIAGVEGFETFCLERNEFFRFGTRYESVISDRAVFGGNGGPFDLLDGRTAWLYEQFRLGAAGSLDDIVGGGFDFAPGAGREVSALALQQAIWFLETEPNTVLSALAQRFVDTANTRAQDAGFVERLPNGSYITLSLGDVRVLQLWDVGFVGEMGHFHQDMVAFIPLPAAAWAGLASLGGVMLLGYVRRRSLQRQDA